VLFGKKALFRKLRLFGHILADLDPPFTINPLCSVDSRNRHSGGYPFWAFLTITFAGREGVFSGILGLLQIRLFWCFFTFYEKLCLDSYCPTANRHEMLQFLSPAP
jgi:hypothetical protein